jgi:REP element-mobilizing transposase RayT
MRNFRRYDVPHTPYFVTTVTGGRRRYFSDPRLAQIVVDNLRFYENRGDFELLSYVVMPDHLHLLATPIRGSISEIMRNVKCHAAREVNELLGQRGSVWQVSFQDRIVRCEGDIERFVQYIEYNPVKARIVAEPEDYLFGSARDARRNCPGSGQGP